MTRTPSRRRTSAAAAVLSKRKMITAFWPLCRTKAYMYSTLTLSLDNAVRISVQPAGLVCYLHGHHLGVADGKAVFFEQPFGLLVVVDDQPQDAEIGGVGQRERPDVDAAFLKDAGHLRQAAGLVFQEYRNLLCVHVRLPSDFSLVDHPHGLAFAALDALGLHQLDPAGHAQHFA